MSDLVARDFWYHLSASSNQTKSTGLIESDCDMDIAFQTVSK